MCYVYRNTSSHFVYLLGMAWGVLMKAKNRTLTHHILCATFIVISLLFTVFRFGPVAVRVWQSLKDLIYSLGHYGTRTVYNIGWISASAVVAPTVVEIPIGMETLLPIEWELFKELFEVFLNRLVDVNYLELYFVNVGEKIAEASEILLLFIIPLTLLVIVLILAYSTENNDHNKDSEALIRFKKFRPLFLISIF